MHTDSYTPLSEDDATAWDFEADGVRHTYPEDAPRVMLDTGQRTADACVVDMIGAVADVLDASGDRASAEHAEAMAVAAREDAGGLGDVLEELREQAENLPNVYVNWDGEAGTVSVSLADRWLERCGRCGRAVTGRSASEYRVTVCSERALPVTSTVMAADAGWAQERAVEDYVRHIRQAVLGNIRAFAEKTGQRAAVWDVHEDDGTNLCSAPIRERFMNTLDEPCDDFVPTISDGHHGACGHCGWRHD